MEHIRELSELLRQRNQIDERIGKIIERPAEKGHLGEFIGSMIFDIELNKSAANKGFDGRFRSGNHKGRTVNIKWYTKRTGILDLNLTHRADYYLVLCGPKASAISSRRTFSPWIIEEVFLFESESLLDRLKGRGSKIGVATSVTREEWENARIFPGQANPFALSKDAITALKSLAPTVLEIVAPPPDATDR